jgi:hypothetical protein
MERNQLELDFSTIDKQDFLLNRKSIRKMAIITTDISSNIITDTQNTTLKVGANWISLPTSFGLHEKLTAIEQIIIVGGA